jgi:uncharacterized protein (PEP-CTERM system associated)
VKPRRKAACVLGLTAFGVGLAGLATPSAAVAQTAGLLPSSASDVNLGDLRQRYESVLSAEPPPTQPGFTFSPAITISGFYASPVAPGAGTSSSSRSDVGLIVNPSLVISGGSQRIQGTLAYSPEATVYAQDGSANSFGQNFNANVHAILVPDTLFLDARGTGGLSSAQGGYGGAAAQGLSRSQMSQNYAFQISPLLQHRFDGTGIFELGYTFADTIVDNGSQVPMSDAFGTVAPNQDETTNAAHVSFTSGENYGRVRFGGQLSGSQSTGGSLGASHRYNANTDLAYGITREITALGSLGYENIHYGGTSAADIRDMTWSLGTRLLPDPKSSITLSYGHHDGGNSFSFDGSYQLGTRLVATGRYSQGIGTAAEDLQNALSSSRLDPFGNPVDSVTGVPLVLEDDFFGSSGTVNRTERYTASLAYLLDRDVITVATRTDHSRVLSASTQTAGGPSSTSGTYVSAAWQHDVSDAVTTNASYQYGIRTGTGSTGTVGTSTEYINTVSLGASWQLSKTVTTSAQYALDVVSSRTPGTSETSHYVVVTVNKQF